jgi:alpha-glucosidase
MQDVEIPEGQSRDPWGANVSFLGRDGARTPMQWTSGVNAGFTDGTPWLPLAPDYEQRNVETESTDEASILNLYRRLIRLRSGSSALRIGSFLSHPSSNEDVLVYRKEADDDTKTIALNLSDAWCDVKIRAGSVVLSSLDHKRSGRVNESLSLAPREGVIVDHP